MTTLAHSLTSSAGPSGCSVLIGNSVGVVNRSVTQPWTSIDYLVPFDPTLLHADLYWQVLVVSGPQYSLSNALTTRLGGLHQ